MQTTYSRDAVNFKTFEKRCKESGLNARECSPYHWQVIGGKFLINYFLGRRGRKIYVGKTNHAIPGSDNLAIRYANELPDSIDRSVRKPTYSKFKSRLWRRSHVCGLCKNEITEYKDASVDHIIPISRGGLNHHSNYQLTHVKCNNEKGSTV